MTRKPRLLLVTPSFQTFIKQDMLLLMEKYDLTVDTYNWRKKELAPLYLIQQFFNLWKHIFNVDLIVVQFGGYWSFLPSLAGRVFSVPVYIILHGTDCAAIPDLQYGSLRIPLLNWFCKRSYEMATKLLPVSESLVKTSNDFYTPGRQLANGFLHHFPHIRTPYAIVPNGFDYTYWKPDPSIVREQASFMAVLSKEQYLLKGGDLIVELAKRFPDSRFTIIGMNQPSIRDSFPPNLTFISTISQDQLRAHYQKTTYFFQLSIFEGFGCALCEAMLCGCIPIGSNVNNIPMIIGETGYLLFKRDINVLEKLVRSLLSSPETSLGLAARDRIRDKFSLAERKNLLFKHFNL
jgi:glycosyltransferase involved in cell wall biosynthesis